MGLLVKSTVRRRPWATSSAQRLLVLMNAMTSQTFTNTLKVKLNAHTERALIRDRLDSFIELTRTFPVVLRHRGGTHRRGNSMQLRLQGRSLLLSHRRRRDCGGDHGWRRSENGRRRGADHHAAKQQLRGAQDHPAQPGSSHVLHRCPQGHGQEGRDGRGPAAKWGWVELSGEKEMYVTDCKNLQRSFIPLAEWKRLLSQSQRAATKCVCARICLVPCVRRSDAFTFFTGEKKVFFFLPRSFFITLSHDRKQYNYRMLFSIISRDFKNGSPEITSIKSNNEE